MDILILILIFVCIFAAIIVSVIGGWILFRQRGRKTRAHLDLAEQRIADFYYYDQNDQRQGPFSKQQIKELAAQKTITPETLLEDDAGQQEVAGQIPELFVPSSPIIDHSISSATQGTPQHEPSPGFFDFGFTRFITNTATSILWAMTVVLTILGYVGYTIYHFYTLVNHPELGVMVVGWAIVVFVAYTLAAVMFLLWMRMVFELEIVVFRIEKHLRSVEKQSEAIHRLEEHLRSVEKNSETLSRIEEHLRAIRDRDENK